MEKLTFICLFAFILSGCGGAGTYRFGGLTFTKKIKKNERANIFVHSSEEIDVFINSAPKGFALKKNKLEVEDGYNHEILEKIKVFEKASLVTNKKHVIKELQREAYALGANAVIYCVFRSDIETGEVKRKFFRTAVLGSGWAVIVKE